MARDSTSEQCVKDGECCILATSANCERRPSSGSLQPEFSEVNIMPATEQRDGFAGFAGIQTVPESRAYSALWRAFACSNTVTVSHASTRSHPVLFPMAAVSSDRQCKSIDHSSYVCLTVNRSTPQSARPHSGYGVTTISTLLRLILSTDQTFNEAQQSPCLGERSVPPD
jgi:hypothetical protein